MSMIIYKMLAETESEVYLITKDHFGEVLSEISQQYYNNRMHSLTPTEALQKMSEIVQKNNNWFFDKGYFLVISSWIKLYCNFNVAQDK